MRAALPLGAYRPGTSWLHRLPAAPKLAGLAGLGAALLVLPQRWAWAGATVMLGAVCATAMSARLPLRPVLTALRGPALLALLLGAYQLWRSGWQTALGVGGTLVALVLAGFVVTMTTPLDATIDVVVRASRPLRRIGLGPERVALAVALMLRGIPALLEISTASRDAARARGLERHARAVLVPTVIRTVAHARRVGEALEARGLPAD